MGRPHGGRWVVFMHVWRQRLSSAGHRLQMLPILLVTFGSLELGCSDPGPSEADLLEGVVPPYSMSTASAPQAESPVDDGPSASAGDVGAGSQPGAEMVADVRPKPVAEPTAAPQVEAPEPKPLPSLIGDVALSVPSQMFEGSLSIELSTTVDGAEIRYTTDGSLPGASSQPYTGSAITVTETTQLRAQVFANGAAVGEVSTGLYVARDFEFSSDLPIVVVHGYGQGKPSDKDVYMEAAILVFEPSGGSPASTTNLPTVATRAGYHVRGQSSSRFPKTPYRLELWDNHDEDADYPLFGMPAEADWALISPYYDRTLIRNPFVYGLGKEIGLDAPRTAYAEVFINYDGNTVRQDDYQGIYWFTETIKNAKARLDLSQLEETDVAAPEISGGYIFKFDQAASEEPRLDCSGSAPLSGSGFGFGGGGFGQVPGGFGQVPGGFGQVPGAPGQSAGGIPTTGAEPGTCWVDLEVVDPEPLAPEQAAWLTEYIQAFHDSLHEEPIGNYAEYIDVDSFVDYLIVNEFTRNIDAYVRSAYYHKDRGGKLRAGPLWDYNFSLALGGQNSQDPMGRFQYEGSRNVNNWYQRLTSDPMFMSRVVNRWLALRQGVLSNPRILERIDQLTAPLQTAIDREYERWPVQQIYANPGIVRGPTADSWEEQVDAMRQFALARAAYLDTQYR